LRNVAMLPNLDHSSRFGRTAFDAA